MALVGDIIVRARELFPDPTINVLGSLGSIANSPSTSGGTLAGATYYFVFTCVNQWGEALGTSEIPVVVGAGNTGSISFTGIILPSGAIGYRIYAGTLAGNENSWVQVVGNANYLMTAFPLPNPGSPPIRNTAWLPDTDGSFVSASTMFRWMNDALKKGGRIAGGILSLAGIQAIAGQQLYTAPGKWIKFTNAWFDGWPISFSKRGDIFLHNAIGGISGLFSSEGYADTTLFQLFPQPNRTGASTIVGTPAVLPTDISIQCANNSSFLPFGIMLIDQEIMAYSTIQVSTIFGGVTRGLMGTTPVGHAIGANITELNIRVSGFRQPVEYVPGDSSKTITIPPAWEVPMIDYVVGQYKRAEKQVQEGMALEKSFEEAIKEFTRLNRLSTQPMQMGSATREVYPGGFGGGILIP